MLADDTKSLRLCYCFLVSALVDALERKALIHENCKLNIGIVFTAVKLEFKYSIKQKLEKWFTIG